MAEAVELGGLVVGDPAAEDLGLPGGGGRLEPLELLHRDADPGVAPQLRAGGDVLPAEAEADEVDGADRLHRLAPAGAGVGVHAGQQPPGAPLDRVGPGGVARG